MRGPGRGMAATIVLMTVFGALIGSDGRQADADGALGPLVDLEYPSDPDGFMGESVGIHRNHIVTSVHGHGAPVYEHVDGTFTRQGQLPVAGYRVAASERLVVVLTPESPYLHAFELSGGSWVEVPGASLPRAAKSVATAGDLIIASHTSPAGAGAWVLERTDSGWTRTSLPAPSGTGYSYGEAVATDGGSVLVASPAPGPAQEPPKVVIWQRSGDDWLVRSSLESPAGELRSFGYSVAISAGMIAVGSITSGGGSGDPASVYLYRQAGGGAWVPAGHLTTLRDQACDFFGHAVALHAGVLLVGAPSCTSSLGYVAVYEQRGDGWTLSGIHDNPDPRSSGFGAAVARRGHVNVVGAMDTNSEHADDFHHRTYAFTSNHDPVAEDDTTTTDEATAVTIDVLANDSDPDGDPVQLTKVTTPSSGVAKIQDGQLVYAPEAGFTGADTFTYTVADDQEPARTATADVTVLVTDAGTPLTRLWGDDRIRTAIRVSEFQFGPDGADAVVIARSDEFADALAGVPFAVQERAPLLLTYRDSLPDAVVDEIARVLRSNGRIYVLGGEAAVTPPVYDALAALGYPVERIWGDDRYETSVAIADELDRIEIVLLSTGTTFADALSGGAASTQVDAAILLTAGDQPHEVTTAAIERLDAPRVVALGGPAADAYPEAEPIVGKTRIDTAIKVADEFFDGASVVGIARSDEFPDALAGATHIAKFGGPILLNPPGPLDPRVAAWLSAHRNEIVEGFVYGGEAAVSASAFDAILDALTG